MFIALDKLFALHNAMLFESRVIIAFLVYSVAIFIVYMLTSIKHAYNVRHRLYLVSMDGERQGRLIHIVRSIFAVSASVQYVYAIFKYRDYEVLNHEMLLMLMEKVNGMQPSKEALGWEMDTESEINWCKWVDTELTEDVHLLDDANYLLPEEVDENSSVTTTSHTKR